MTWIRSIVVGSRELLLRWPGPDPAAAFHAHLDRCHQCESRPFDLCPERAALLAATPDRGRPESPAEEERP